MWGRAKSNKFKKVRGIFSLSRATPLIGKYKPIIPSYNLEIWKVITVFPTLSIEMSKIRSYGKINNLLLASYDNSQLELQKNQKN